MSYEIVGTKLSAKYDYDRPKSEKSSCVFDYGVDISWNDHD